MGDAEMITVFNHTNELILIRQRAVVEFNCHVVLLGKAKNCSHNSGGRKEDII